MNNYIEVVFIKDEKNLKISELSEFLYNLKVFYSIIFEKFGERINVTEDPHKIVDIARRIVSEMERVEKREYFFYTKYNFFRRNLGIKDVFISKIYKESPLTIWFIAVNTILVAALIISGGEIEINFTPPRIRIKIPSIGEGLKKLKEAFKR